MQGIPKIAAEMVRPGPRVPTTNERLERVLVRNAFAHNGDDRVIPEELDLLVGLIWVGDRYVPAVIPEDGVTDDFGMMAENLRRPIEVVEFVGTTTQLEKVGAPRATVSGRVFGYDPLDTFRRLYRKRRQMLYGLR